MTDAINNPIVPGLAGKAQKATHAILALRAEMAKVSEEVKLTPQVVTPPKKGT